MAFPFLTKRIYSFKCAFKGVVQLVKGEINFLIHIAAAILVNAAGLYFSLTAYEWLAIWICIGMVFTAEAMNTAIEKLVDLVEPEFNLKAGKVKDIAAAGVLFSAILSIIVAAIIFIPRVI